MEEIWEKRPEADGPDRVRLKGHRVLLPDRQRLESGAGDRGDWSQQQSRVENDKLPDGDVQVELDKMISADETLRESQQIMTRRWK